MWVRDRSMGLVGALLVAATLASCATSVSARPGRYIRGASEPGVDSSTGWLTAHMGMTFGDTVNMGQALTLTSAAGPAPVFAIGAFYRTARLDFGVLLETIGSFRFQGLERTNRVGGQFRSAANLRWRYVDESWGALFLRLTPGLMVFNHDRLVRAQAAQLVPNSDMDDVDDHSLGFSLGFDFGAVIYLSRRIGLVINLDVVTATTDLDVATESIDYSSIRGLFSMGLEWRM